MDTIKLNNPAEGVFSETTSQERVYAAKENIGENGGAGSNPAILKEEEKACFAKVKSARIYEYSYDEMGNISKIYENGNLSVRYTYDKRNRLMREDNKELNKTYLLGYDNSGNILTRREIGFTVKNKEEIEEIESVSKEYVYEGDRLLSYGNEKCEYDALGILRNIGIRNTDGRKEGSWCGRTGTRLPTTEKEDESGRIRSSIRTEATGNCGSKATDWNSSMTQREWRA